MLRQLKGASAPLRFVISYLKCRRLPPRSRRNDGNKAGHALTFKLDHLRWADHLEHETPVLSEKTADFPD
jgi:hypothetical protein